MNDVTTVSKIATTLYRMPYGGGLGSSQDDLRTAVDADAALELLADYLETLRVRLAGHAEYHREMKGELDALRRQRRAVREFFGFDADTR